MSGFGRSRVFYNDKGPHESLERSKVRIGHSKRTGVAETANRSLSERGQVLIDHGFHTDLPEALRTTFCKLWVRASVLPKQTRSPLASYLVLEKRVNETHLPSFPKCLLWAWPRRARLSRGTSAVT